MIPVDVRAQWKEDWKLASVVIQVLVPDPTIQQPATPLLSLLNSFRSGHGSCQANLNRWGGIYQCQIYASMCSDRQCPELLTHVQIQDWTVVYSGSTTQRQSRTVESYPDTRLDGGLQWLHDSKTVSRTVDSCPDTRLDGGLQLLHDSKTVPNC